MKDYLHLLRINQWVKNILIFAPLFFSGNLFKEGLFEQALYGFFIFSLMASAIYVLNDFKDRELDRLHPVKKNRPLASGKINSKYALTIVTILFTASLLAGWMLDKTFFYILLSYALLNICYSFGLKNLSLLDIFIVASGFVLRVYAGGVLTDTSVSHWLFIMSFLLALFIAFAKRRDDVLIKMQSGADMRSSIKGYNLEFISSSISILCGVLVVTYLLYVTSEDVHSRFPGKPVYVTSLFVLLGILRYLQITLVEGKSGSPTKIFYTDMFIKIVILLWVLLFAYIIYIL